MFKKYPYYFTSLLLVLGISIPLYFLSYHAESLVSFGLICVYLLVDKFLDALIYIGSKLKWDRFAIVVVGFFGVKNAFFFAFLGYLSNHNYLNSNLTIIILAMLYAVYSILIGLKMINMEKSKN